MKITYILASVLASLLICFSVTGLADITRIIPESTITLLAEEVSGVSAKRNLDTVTLYHRTRASSQFRKATEHILVTLEGYGFDNAEIIEYPADGKTMFGTQKSRPAWDVEFAELWEVGTDDAPLRRYANWEAMPLSVAQDSVSGSVVASLVDIGGGTADSDYAGKNIKGRLVLTSSQPEAVAARAVAELGAAGIISYAPNQVTAWWKEDDRLVRWGHLDSFDRPGTFGFMVSLRDARQLQARLADGEDIRFSAEIRAGHEVGSYSLLTALIPGSDDKLGNEEIVFSCHLDHPRPGANDNASGCVSILETARTLQALVSKKLLPAPKRGLRFIWPAEIEGSLIYLAAMQDTSHIRANIHLDMVGGGQQTKSVFRISGGPMSMPTFIADVGHEIGHFVNDQTERYASGDNVPFPLVSREGSKNPQLALMEGINLGSDHQVFNEGSWSIPGIYLHDWPDRYIHTNFDTAAMIDPTKLKRAAFIAALQGWYLANFDSGDIAPVLQLLRANALQRARGLALKLPTLSEQDRTAAFDVHWQVEALKIQSVSGFASPGRTQAAAAVTFIRGLEELLERPPQVAADGDERVFTRNPEIKGTMDAFGYSYLQDHLSADEYAGLTLSGAHAYEALNLVDGTRTVSGIRDWLVAEFASAANTFALADVAKYLEALEKINVIQLKPGH